MLSLLIALAALAAPAVIDASATTINASGECRQLDAGKAPAPSPNTPPSFLDFAYHRQTTENATHPLKYERFMAAGHAPLHDDAAYVTYEEMETYDASACARRCDEEKTYTSFNIYFQRRPIQVPGAACPNPDATVDVHCALFSASINISKATNDGQICGPANSTGDFFEVRVAGSNAYNQLVSPSQNSPMTVTVTAMTILTAWWEPRYTQD